MVSRSERYAPLPATVRAFNFYSEKNAADPSLVDSRRIVRTHAINRRFLQVIFCTRKKAHSVGLELA